MSFRRKIVAGNWKMNNSLTEALSLMDGILANLDTRTTTEIIVCPAYPFIGPIIHHLKDFNRIKLAAQNCSEHVLGAYTGEVSASMLKSIDCDYVIVGHSERRTYFNEGHDQLKEKIKRALESDLAPIFCIGEKIEHRKNNTHFNLVKDQIKNVLSSFKVKELEKLIIAYEPVWAIGTGVTATSSEAQEMHVFIRQIISELFGQEFARETPILYGGSCNPQNAKELFSCADVDGGLIGGASLKANDFCSIIQSF
jgi:triosephosphate isomerase